jgi:hypothetical protein
MMTSVNIAPEATGKQTQRPSGFLMIETARSRWVDETK